MHVKKHETPLIYPQCKEPMLSINPKASGLAFFFSIKNKLDVFKAHFTGCQICGNFQFKNTLAVLIRKRVHTRMQIITLVLKYRFSHYIYSLLEQINRPAQSKLISSAPLRGESVSNAGRVKAKRWILRMCLACPWECAQQSFGPGVRRRLGGGGLSSPM